MRQSIRGRLPGQSASSTFGPASTNFGLEKLPNSAPIFLPFPLSEGFWTFPCRILLIKKSPKRCQSFFPSVRDCSGISIMWDNEPLYLLHIYYIQSPQKWWFHRTSRPAVSASIFRPAPCKAPLEPSDILSMWPQLKETEGYWRHGGNSTHPPDISRVAGCWLQDGTGTLWSFCMFLLPTLRFTNLSTK